LRWHAETEFLKPKVYTPNMDAFSEELILWLLGQVVVSAAIWGAIRSDLKWMHREFDKHDYRIGRSERKAEEADARMREQYEQLDRRITEAHQRIGTYVGHSRKEQHTS
jgi:hypothetical protein